MLLPWILISLDSEQFLMNFFQPEVMDERGNTPFLEACRYGNFYAAERLLRLGADPLACNRAGLNAWDVLAEALAGIKQQKRKKLCSSRFSDLPQEYGLREPEEVPQDDDGLYELARLLHAHSIPARHPEKTIAHILAAAERHTLENFPFRPHLSMVGGGLPHGKTGIAAGLQFFNSPAARYVCNS